ncbi:hypothetical protein Tco_0304835 [Tanacetum coccineum]
MKVNSSRNPYVIPDVKGNDTLAISCILIGGINVAGNGRLRSKKVLLAEERFLKIKQVVEEEQNQPEDENDFDEDNFDEDDFDEEGENDNDIFQIEDKILREKLLNANRLIDKIKALKLTHSIPFMLNYPSSSPIPVVDSDFLVEEVNTFLVPEDSIPPGIESDLDSEGDIVFLNNLLNDDPILEYERFTFDIEPDVPVINNFNELNEDECFDPGGGEIDVSQNVEDDDSFAFVIRTFLPYRTYPVDSPLLLFTGSEDTILNPRHLYLEAGLHLIGMDSAKITRKRSKLDKHEHRNGKNAQEPKNKDSSAMLHVSKRKRHKRALIGQDVKGNDTQAYNKHTKKGNITQRYGIATLAIRVPQF